MHNRKRNRLKNFDYTKDGFYFVTICSEQRGEVFGTIKESKPTLNIYGNIIESTLFNITERYCYLNLDHFIVMPDHIHIIIIIDSPDNSKLKIKSISEIIGTFKTVSSKEIHSKGYKDFKWQRSFYDRIIRNEKELLNIRNYISQNPLRLELKNVFPENIEF